MSTFPNYSCPLQIQARKKWNNILQLENIQAKEPNTTPLYMKRRTILSDSKILSLNYHVSDKQSKAIHGFVLRAFNLTFFFFLGNVSLKQSKAKQNLLCVWVFEWTVIKFFRLQELIQSTFLILFSLPKQSLKAYIITGKGIIARKKKS